MSNPSSAADRDCEAHFARNILALASFEGVWALGMPFIMFNVVVPAYLLALGAPKTLVLIGQSALLLTAPLTLLSQRIYRGRRRLRRQVMTWMLFASAWVGYGLFAEYVDPSARTLWTTFLVHCTLLGVMLNLASPVYSEMCVVNVPIHRRGLSAGIRLSSLGVVGIAASRVADRLMQHWAVPTNYHYGFIAGGIICALSSLCLSILHDCGEATDSGSHESMRASVARLLKDFNFRIFMLFYLFLVAAIQSGPLIMGLGQDLAVIDSAASARYVTCSLSAYLMAGMLVSPLADRFGFRLHGRLANLLMLMALATLLLALTYDVAGPWLIYGAYTCHGLAGAVAGPLMVNLGAELCDKHRPSTLAAVGTMCALPVCVGLAPLLGLLVDTFAVPGYVAAFAVSMAFALCSLLGFVFLIREPRTGQTIIRVSRRSIS